MRGILAIRRLPRTGRRFCSAVSSESVLPKATGVNEISKRGPVMDSNLSVDDALVKLKSMDLRAASLAESYEIYQVLRATRDPALGPLVDAIIPMEGVTLEQLVGLMETCCQLQIRAPLRACLPILMKHLFAPTPAVLHQGVMALNCLGRGMVFHGDLFQLCYDNLDKMDSVSLAMYIYECGRHGLRCKHFIDQSLNTVIAQAENMSTRELLMTSHGLIRFIRDSAAFYELLPERIDLKELNHGQLALLLKVCRELRGSQKFVDFQNRISSELITLFSQMSVVEKARMSHSLIFHPKMGGKTHALVRKIVEDISACEDLTQLLVTDILDALEMMASSGIRHVKVLERLSSLAAERVIEIKYSPNISIWRSITSSLGRLEFYSAAWMDAVIELASDKYMVEKIGFFHTVAFLTSLAKLNTYSEAVYKNIAEILMKDIHLVNRTDVLSQIMYAFTKAGHIDKALFDALYDQMIKMFEDESIDLSRDRDRQLVIQITQSFCIAGYHSLENFAPFLDYAFHNADDGRVYLKRLHLIADAVLMEAPETAKRSLYYDVIKGYSQHASGNKVERENLPTLKLRNKMIDDISSELSRLGIQYSRDVVNPLNAVPVDFELKIPGHDEVAILVVSPDRSMREGPRGLDFRLDSGFMVFYQRLLEARGYTVIKISYSEMSKTSYRARGDFIVTKLADAGVTVPFAQ